MIQREQIEKMLRVNGVSPTDSEDEIKSVLISAQWHKNDVEAAILVLRENKTDHKTHVDSLHKIFRSDDRLSPEAVTSLLGIEMNMTSKDIKKRHKRERGGMTPFQMLKVTIVSLILSFLFVYAAMWYLHIGMFHQTVL